MGGVRILFGEYDGTKPAAVMVNGLDDVPFGPLFVGEDAHDQIDAFREWLRQLQFMSRAEEIGLTLRDVPSPGLDGDDPRHWPDGGLRKLAAYWKTMNLDEHGALRETT
jgi:hypothetical protein